MQTGTRATAVAPTACPGCGMDDLPLRHQPWGWSVKRWLCTWCAELNETAHRLGHDLRLPWALPDPTIRSRR